MSNDRGGGGAYIYAATYLALRYKKTNHKALHSIKQVHFEAIYEVNRCQRQTLLFVEARHHLVLMSNYFVIHQLFRQNLS